MPLIPCPDCGTEVSDRAPVCPKCGRPIAPPVMPPSPTPFASAATVAQVASTPTVNKSGAFCPNCKGRDSYKTTGGTGCVFWVFVIISMGLALIMIPFLPKTWHCRVCGNQWRA